MSSLTQFGVTSINRLGSTFELRGDRIHEIVRPTVRCDTLAALDDHGRDRGSPAVRVVKQDGGAGRAVQDALDAVDAAGGAERLASA